MLHVAIDLQLVTNDEHYCLWFNVQIGEDINLHLSEKFCYGLDRISWPAEESTWNGTEPSVSNKNDTHRSKRNCPHICHTYGTYHLWGWVRLSTRSTCPLISGINSQSHFIHIFACVQRWLLICVDNRSSVQMNTYDQRTTINLWNRKVLYDFIFKVQISDSEISSGFAVVLWSLKGPLPHMDLCLSRVWHFHLRQQMRHVCIFEVIWNINQGKWIF